MLARCGFPNLSTFNRCIVGVICNGHGFHSSRPTSKDSCESPGCSASGKRTELMDVACKIAVITGGTSGIGYACAQQLLCNGLQKAVIAGANKCEGDEAVKSLNGEFGKDKAVFYKVDINCQKQFEDLFKEVLNRFRRLDILVNNAGMLNDRHWELEVETNIKGMIRGTLLAFKYMATTGSCHKGEGGIVINVSSILGLDPLPTIPVYSTTKHAIVGFTKNMGDKYHFDSTQLRVTAMCPGFTPTPLVTDFGINQLCDKWGQDAEKTMKSWPQQPPASCGKALVHMVKYAPSGTVWVVEDSKIYRADIPERKDYCKFIKSLM